MKVEKVAFFFFNFFIYFFLLLGFGFGHVIFAILLIDGLIEFTYEWMSQLTGFFRR